MVSGQPWLTVRMEQRALVGIDSGIVCLFLRDWSLRLLDVCICTEASEKGFAFAVREGCRELASEVGRVSERTSFQRSSRSGRAKSCGLKTVAPESFRNAPRQSRADFPEVSSQLLDPTAWEWVAYGDLFREENIILETRSILHAVQYEESKYLYSF